MTKRKCFFYQYPYCQHPNNDELDIPPCDNCNYYIERQTAFNYIVDITRIRPETQVMRSMEIFEPKILGVPDEDTKRMIYVGFSQHDDESWYKCPVCNQPYGSWGFINGSVKVSDDGTFKCKCGTILVKPK